MKRRFRYDGLERAIVVFLVMGTSQKLPFVLVKVYLCVICPKIRKKKKCIYVHNVKIMCMPIEFGWCGCIKVHIL